MLAPWKKSYDSLDIILKSRDIILLTKIHIVKAILFPVVVYGCESWTIKKAECRRIDAFELWCWKRLYLSVYLFVFGNIEFVLTMLGLCCSLEVARTSGLQSPISC